jgi:transcriptional regulator with XRE-family HTH domain
MRDTDIRARLSLNMRRMRPQKGWSREEFAQKAGQHRSDVSDLERGARNPTITVVDRPEVAPRLPVGALLQAIGAAFAGCTQVSPEARADKAAVAARRDGHVKPGSRQQDQIPCQKGKRPWPHGPDGGIARQAVTATWPKDIAFCRIRIAFRRARKVLFRVLPGTLTG